MNKTTQISRFFDGLTFDFNSKGTAKLSKFPVLSSVATNLKIAAFFALTVVINTIVFLSYPFIGLVLFGISYIIPVYFFEFGSTSKPDGPDFLERNYLIAELLLVSAAIGVCYMLFGTGTFTVTSSAILALAISHQFHKTLKQDVRIYNLSTSKLWLYSQRSILMILLGASVLTSYGFMAIASYFGVMGVTSTAYYTKKYLQDNDPFNRPTTEDVIQENTIETETVDVTETIEESDDNKVPLNTGAELQYREESEGTITLKDEADKPDQLRKRSEKAKELTKELDKHIRQLNNEINERGIGYYTIERVPRDQDKLSPKISEVMFNQIEKLEDQLDTMESSEAKSIAIKKFDVEQTLEEINEFVYK